MDKFEEPKILIVKDTHFTYHFKVTSKTDLHIKCVKLLKARMDAGYYDSNFDEIMDQSDKDKISELLTIIKSDSVKYPIEQMLLRSERDKNLKNKHDKWLKNVSKVINAEVYENHIDVIRQTAYQLLTGRSEYAYEFVELQQFNDFEKFLKDFATVNSD